MVVLAVVPVLLLAAYLQARARNAPFSQRERKRLAEYGDKLRREESLHLEDS